MTARSPLAELTLDDCVARTLDDVRRVAEHGPVVLVGHSLGGSMVTGVANAEPALLSRTTTPTVGTTTLTAVCTTRPPRSPTP